MKMEDILDSVKRERERQTRLWGEQNHGVMVWLGILAEEFGEVAKEANEVHFRDRHPADYRIELIQTAAVCVAAIESLDRGNA